MNRAPAVSQTFHPINDPMKFKIHFSVREIRLNVGFGCIDSLAKPTCSRLLQINLQIVNILLNVLH